MNQIVILAAGKGTRMGSDLPKVLHPVQGVPIIEHILRNTRSLVEKPVVVVGHGREQVMAALGDRVNYVHQAEQLGTGHAVRCARETLQALGVTRVLVTPGDHPLISTATFERMLSTLAETGATVVLASVVVPDFDGDSAQFAHFGRIVRGVDGAVDRIVEYKDATEAERAIREVNTSYYCFDAAWLWDALDRLSDDNAAHEYYLTDTVGLARDDGHTVAVYTIEDPIEGLGINTPEQLALIERYCREHETA
jgi:bifunctional UDP-N-acetylglucosamine pyrophosphorylase/glucosamine-1-phosphate N-acetyltransferase